MTMMQHRQVRYIGLDVHKRDDRVAIAEAEGGAPSRYGTIANDPSAIRKLMTRLGGADVELRVAYEAGPTGYALHRQLAKLGIACMVVAPSLIPMRPGDKVKTDRRDALKLARLLRSGDLTSVWVPDEAHEALRNLVRARADAKADELRAKHRLSKFLLRQGSQPPVGYDATGRSATSSGCGKLQFEHLPDRVVFADYLAEVTAAGERIKRLEAALRAVRPELEPGGAHPCPAGLSRHWLPERGDHRCRSWRSASLPNRTAVHGLRWRGPFGILQWRQAAAWARLPRRATVCCGTSLARQPTTRAMRHA